MLDFLPYFQIVIGLYISFCFEKLIQSLLWSEKFTKGLTCFYKEWSTLAWYNESDKNEDFLQKSIEDSIADYVSRTKKLGLFMLVSVSTMLVSYCWVGHHIARSDQFLIAYSLWNLLFFILVFCRSVWTVWRNIITLYLCLLIITLVTFLLLSHFNVILSHTIKVILMLENVTGITFPLIVELFRARIRSELFLEYLSSYKDKFSKRCSALLLAIVNGEYTNSKYLLQMKDAKIQAFKDGEQFDKSKLIKTLMETILRASEKQALKILTEDSRSLKIMFYNRFRDYFIPVELDKLESEDDLFKLSFSMKRSCSPKPQIK